MSSLQRLDDPLAVLAIGLGRGKTWIMGAVLVAASGHAAVGICLERWKPKKTAPTATLPMIVEIETAPLPPPPPEPARESETSAAPAKLAHATPNAPRAAQAAAAVTRAADPAGALDLTSGLVTGSATEYSGGTTSSLGTTGSAPPTVVQPPSVTSAPSRVASPPVTRSDRSKRPGVDGGFEWQCPFPPEADAEQVDRGAAQIRVAVDAAGRVTSVVVVNDSGHGFGSEARRCALGKRWTAGSDVSGAPTDGAVTISVHFER